MSVISTGVGAVNVLWKEYNAVAELGGPKKLFVHLLNGTIKHNYTT